MLAGGFRPSPFDERNEKANSSYQANAESR
jgi:hypothetical protein